MLIQTFLLILIFANDGTQQTVSSKTINTIKMEKSEQPGDQSKTGTSNQQTPEIVDFRPDIISEENKFIAINRAAYVIREFVIKENTTFECTHSHLPVRFVFLGHITTGFMQSNDKELLISQKVSEPCRKIRRYLFLSFFWFSHD
jgi:hypothetical protein